MKRAAVREKEVRLMTIRTYRLVLLFATTLGMAPPTPAQDADYSHYVSPWKTHWDYSGPRGPEHWSALDPAYALCNTGKQQSPIDIRGTQQAALPALRFEYRGEPLRYLINNGATIRINYHDAAGSGNDLLLGDQRYQLMQLHFHRPSEELVHGKRYDMVLHLMHQANDGHVLGVAVLLQSGAANATLQQLWDHIPKTEGQVELEGVSFDPSGLMPRELGYYRYEGSQTAPPCNEGVTWLVLKKPVEISAAQIAAFAQLFPHDVRPPQALNGRIVEESE
jgi:carbonic anhydrase